MHSLGKTNKLFDCLLENPPFRFSKIAMFDDRRIIRNMSSSREAMEAGYGSPFILLGDDLMIN